MELQTSVTAFCAKLGCFDFRVRQVQKCYAKRLKPSALTAIYVYTSAVILGLQFTHIWARNHTSWGGQNPQLSKLVHWGQENLHLRTSLLQSDGLRAQATELTAE